MEVPLCDENYLFVDDKKRNTILLTTIFMLIIA